jgi:hypothetical protein
MWRNMDCRNYLVKVSPSKSSMASNMAMQLSGSANKD